MMTFKIRWIFLLSCTLFSTSSTYGQVVMRDTLLEWQHFDYALTENFGLASYSSTQIVTSTYEGIVLENELVKICIIPEFGARVISFVYKPTGREQFYQNPVGTPYSIGTNIFYHNWLMVYGGVFPTFPEPEHGKYWHAPWDMLVTEDTESRKTISMWKKDDLNVAGHPGQYNNGATGITCYFNVSLESGKPYFSVDVQLTNDETANNYEYWTCITFAPGSEIGATATPGNSEMIVPIDRYQVAWNPGNWMNSLDPVIQASGPRVQQYDKLALLSNWENMGIAYAYPTLTANYYGVINHTNEEGLFRLSSDQSTTPGMKFWTWGDTQGQNADPYNFNQAERPYIELWSGTSQEFFEDAYLGANASISWTEHYFPTVGIPGVSFLNEDIAFHWNYTDGQVNTYAFLPVGSGYSIETVAQVGQNVMYSETDALTAATAETSHTSHPVAEAVNGQLVSIVVTLKKDNEIVYQEERTVDIPLSGKISDEWYATVTIPQSGRVQVSFSNMAQRHVRLVDFTGRIIDEKIATQQDVELSYSMPGAYIIQVREKSGSWYRKIGIR